MPALTAKRERKSEFAGVGCVIQGAGLLAPFIGALAGTAGFAIGLVIMLALLVAGSMKSSKWVCGHCRNPLATKDVRICPACRATLE